MKDSWHNNLIGKILNEEYKHDFSMCDVDGLVTFMYYRKRLIIYESKNENESLTRTQLRALQTLDDAISWDKFDRASGLFILRIHDIRTDIAWLDSRAHEIMRTTLDELYQIFSGKNVDLDLRELLQ